MTRASPARSCVISRRNVCTAEELVNGDLLRAAEDAGFEVMVTADQSLECQQNLKGRKLALVVLSTNHIGVLETYPDWGAKALGVDSLRRLNAKNAL